MPESQHLGQCPIWGTDAIFVIPAKWRDSSVIQNSPRAGGGYEISGTATVTVQSLNERQKALLTTMLVDRRMQGDDIPFISSRDVDQAKVEKNISVANRADRLLKYLSKKSEENYVGYILYINSALNQDNIKMYYETLAWSESIELQEVKYLIKYLSRQNLVDTLPGYESNAGFACVITVDGYRQVQENILKPDSSQAFVAMWFGEEMNEDYEEGIKKAINNTGYKPMRIDKKEDVNKIDDEIIAEIRRSHFLIADFTQGDDGARGGVYYEAGFATGLDIPVIYSCRKDMVDKLHFDTRQYYHVVWETADELRDGLEKRILALVGEGPLAAATVS